MKKTIYYTLKIAIGVYIAFLLSDFLMIKKPVSVAIITILSVKETRKKSIYVSLKRFLAGNVAILFSFIIFYFIGYKIEGLVILLIIYIPFAFKIKARESIISGLVLASHVLSFKEISLNIYLEENLILLIGILTGFFLIIHMPDVEQDLIEYKNIIENSFSKIMLNMSYSLKNLCFIEETINLEELENEIKKAKKLSFKYKENSLIDDNKHYYVNYFQMRLIQLYRLMYMRNHFNNIFITQQKAIPLSKMTSYISKGIGKELNIDEILKALSELRKDYKNSPLPKSRIEFENRSVLFQYLNDLEEFMNIKKRYLKNINDK